MPSAPVQSASKAASGTGAAGGDGVLDAPAALPAGYTTAALFPDHAHVPLRIGVVVRREADPVAGHFVVLRTLFDATVYLGCITDAGNHVHGYVEIWVQNLDGLAASPAAAREALTNHALDARWGRWFRMLDEAGDAALGEMGGSGAVYRTGFEAVHPAPLFFDAGRHVFVHPRAKGGGPGEGETAHAGGGGRWMLCTDDGVLAAKQLPAYTTSLHRYLHVPGDSGTRFVPMTPGAPTNEHTGTLADMTGEQQAGGGGGLEVFNPGNLLLVRGYSPAGLEAFFDLLSGGTWEGILAGRSAVHLSRLNESLEEKTDGASATAMADGRLFLGKHGRWGRLIETYHLKLRLLADCVAAVRELTRQAQRPLLNLTAPSFQVDIGARGAGRAAGLPFLWTASASLVDPGDAVTLQFEASEARYFLRGVTAPANVYQPESAGQPASGRGTLRIRKTMAESAGLIIEGTLTTKERLGSGAGEGGGPSRNDLVWLRAPVGAGRVDLYGHVEKDSALAAGEWRFRTERQQFTGEVAGQLKAAEGVPIPETVFDVIPLLSSPCDMYSLAILGARAVLVNDDTTLAIVADELISLARQVALEHREDAPLGERIRSIFQADTRWLKALGPQRLTREEMTAQDAFDLVPADVWFEMLGLFVRMLPGVGPDSFCRDYGDAPRGGLHKIYDGAMEQLERLLVRTRSLIVIDWRFNREIHAVLRQFSAAAQV